MEPAPAPRHHEGDEARYVVGRTETGDVDVRPVPFAHLRLALASALDIGPDAAPEPLGLYVPRVDGVDLHVVGLSEIGERLGERRTRRIHRAADGAGRDRNTTAGAADGDDR